jgi:putative membrane protein
MMYPYGPGGVGWTLMTVTMLLFWVLVIGGAVVLVRYLLAGDRRERSGRPTGGPAEEMLAERFARGEIDEQDYRHRLEVLRGSASVNGLEE